LDIVVDKKNSQGELPGNSAHRKSIIDPPGWRDTLSIRSALRKTSYPIMINWFLPVEAA